MKNKRKDSIIKSLTGKYAQSLFLCFLILFLVPLCIVVFLYYRNASEMLLQTARNNITHISRLQYDALQNYFQSVEADIQYLSRSRMITEIFTRLSTAYKRSKETLKQFVASPEWRAIINDTYGQELIQFNNKYQYDDIYLIDENGVIIYSINEKNYLGDNIFKNKLANTQFSKACNAALMYGNIQYSDMEIYDSSAPAVVSFLVKPIETTYKDLSGLIGVQIPGSRIDALILNQDAYLTLESYLLGTDQKMRTNTRLSEQPTMLIKKIESAWVNVLLSKLENTAYDNTGEVQYSRFKDYRQQTVIGIQRILKFNNVFYLLNTKLDVAEVLKPLADQNLLFLCIVLSVTIVIFICAGLAIALFVSPLLRLKQWITAFGNGDLTLPELTSPQQANETGYIQSTLYDIIKSTQELVMICEAIAVGEFSQTIPIRSTQDSLGSAVKKIAENYRNFVLQVKKITAGDYSLLFKPFSEHDELGNALYDMISALRYLNGKNSNENWLKTGINELVKRIQGTQRIGVLCDKIVRFICIYLNIHVGILYVNQNGRFEMMASYAVTDLDSRQKYFKYNEGLIGQVAREKKIQIFSSFPENYMKIQSGIMDITPVNIVILPLLFEKNVVAVLELGIVEELNDLQLTFLKQAAGTIAININLTLVYDKLQAAFEKTEKQKVELEHQKEELRVSNEELEEQTIRLQESERRLQQQQEELRQTNEELEEHANLLKKQKEQLQKKTLEIAENAAEVQRISKYKSEFLANMSHELRTPLNSMLILAKLLAENKDKNLTKKQVEFASTVFSSGNDLLTLINEILDLAKIEAKKVTLNIDKINIQAMVKSLMDVFQPVANKNNLVFEANVPKDLNEFIISDEQRLTQILKNLLSNAFKFTSKGSVKLNIYHPRREGFLLKETQRPEEALAFEIADTGIGIPKDKQKVIFDAFQQVDAGISRKYGGTGLGLSICRELVKLLKGEIHLSSEEGQGSKFIVFLPVDYGSAAVEVKAVASAEPVTPPVDDPAKKKTLSEPVPPEIFNDDDRDTLTEKDDVILIIEDDRKFADVLLGLTRERGFKGVVALRGDTGLEMVSRYNPIGILLDLTLPGIDGWSVLGRMKDDIKTRHIPVHIISGTDKELQGLQMGAAGYLKKPVTIEQLNDALAKIVNVARNKVRRLLVIEDNKDQLDAIHAELDGTDLEITAVNTGENAYRKLFETSFDCIVLDLSLPDMTGFELLKKIRFSDEISHIPVIIYTGKELTDSERYELKEYAETIIVKDATSLDLLLDQTSLFLHRVAKDLSEQKKNIISKLHNKEEIFTGKKVLIVDDDMRNVFALSAVLEENNLNVDIAKNGKECIEFLEKTADVDLILMDIMMPIMDGYETIEYIRRMDSYAAIPIIALTAKAMRGDKEKCIQSGASDYLAKPVNNDQLLSLLRVWLYRGY